jgi:hypothetical protein
MKTNGKEFPDIISIMKFVFTRHAKDKIALIGTSEKVAIDTITKPSFVRYSSQNREILEYYGKYDSKHSLKIVLIKTEEEYRIITIILQKSSRDPIISNYIV